MALIPSGYVSAQGNFDYLAIKGPDVYGEWEWPWRSLVDANPNLLIAWQADYPLFTNIDPLYHMWGMVTRKQVGTDGSICEPPGWLKAGALHIEEVLPMMTRSSAYALFVEYCAAGSGSVCPTTSSDTTADPSNVSASAFLPDSPPGFALDGDTGTIWNSGRDPSQWILIDLVRPSTLSRIRLLVSQYPEGETVHQVWAGASPGSLLQVHEFSGFTRDSDTLEFQPDRPVGNIRFIKIVTTRGPSWVPWREIKVVVDASDGIPTHMSFGNAADIIFFNGTILTMEEDQATVQAIAIQGETIWRSAV